MGILDRVKAASESHEDHMKALVHGPSGAGKSTLCGTAPRPILYAYTERQGVVSFKRTAPNEATVHLTGVRDVRELLGELMRAERDEGAGTVAGYRSLCLDSLTECQRLIIDEYIDRKGGGTKTTSKSERISISEWGEIIDRTLQMVRSFRDLPMHVFLTSLSAEHFLGDDDSKRRVVRPEVKGRSLPNELAQFFNVVGYAFKRLGEEGAEYRVLLEGHEEFLTKAMPGLAYREEADLGYWVERALKGAPARNPEAKMCERPGRVNGEKE